jgi:hypothetical protein
MAKYRHPIWRPEFYEESLHHASYPCRYGVCDVPDDDDAAHQWFLNMGYECVDEEEAAGVEVSSPAS